VISENSEVQCRVAMMAAACTERANRGAATCAGTCSTEVTVRHKISAWDAGGKQIAILYAIFFL